MIKAVIFDMDGTIIDSEMMYIDWNVEFYAAYGIKTEPEDFYATVGRSTKYNKSIYLNLWERNGINITLEEHRRRKKEYYDKHKNIGMQNIDFNTLKMPNVDEILAYLKEEGYKLALASSSKMETIERVVDDGKIRDYFEVLATGEDCERSKPYPDVYLHVLKALGVSTEETIVVEDSKTGIEASKAAGITTLARIERRFKFSQRKADYLIEDLMEVKDILDIINNKEN